MLAATEENRVLLVVSLAQQQPQVFVFHVEGCAAQTHPAGDKDRLRVAVAKGVEQLVAGEKIKGELGKKDLRVIS